jgi:hypothetical protein
MIRLGRKPETTGHRLIASTSLADRVHYLGNPLIFCIDHRVTGTELRPFSFAAAAPPDDESAVSEEFVPGAFGLVPKAPPLLEE